MILIINLIEDKGNTIQFLFLLVVSSQWLYSMIGFFFKIIISIIKNCIFLDNPVSRIQLEGILKYHMKISTKEKGEHKKEYESLISDYSKKKGVEISWYCIRFEYNHQKKLNRVFFFLGALTMYLRIELQFLLLLKNFLNNY